MDSKQQDDSQDLGQEQIVHDDGGRETRGNTGVRARSTPDIDGDDSAPDAVAFLTVAPQPIASGVINITEFYNDAMRRVRRGEDVFAEQVASLDQAASGASAEVAKLKAAAAKAAESLEPKKKRCGKRMKSQPPMSAIEARNAVESFLCNVRAGLLPKDFSEMTATDVALESLTYKHLPALRRARAALSVKMKDKTIDLVFRGRIVEMVELLNLHLDPQLSFSWRSASLFIARAHGRGVNHARNLRHWVHQYILYDRLPTHRYGYVRWTVLDDEDISQYIQLRLLEKSKPKDGSPAFITAMDLVDLVSSEDMQAMLQARGVDKPSIRHKTACRWLAKMGWRYGRKRNGMYVDGHERKDVVEYRSAFVQRWKEKYEPRMHTWDEHGNEIHPQAEGTDGLKRLILVTHDESHFHSHDERTLMWYHPNSKRLPERKGPGSSLMVSDFLTSEWGRLREDDNDSE